MSGCDDQPRQKTTGEPKKVPPEIVKLAKEKLPGLTFDAVHREPTDRLNSGESTSPASSG